MAGDIFQRFELKYLIDEKQRRAVEQALALHMLPDEHGKSTICNIYYDTPDFRLIRHSLDKPVYKEKMRLRSYGMTDPEGMVFIELKKKYNGVVYKRRIQLREHEAVSYLNNEAPLPFDSQIGREIDYFRSYYRELRAAVYLCYDREAFFDKDDENLRVTFDENIRWRTDDLSLTQMPDGTDILEKGQSLMEIKTATSIPLWLVDVLSGENIRRAPFSKYGRAYEIMQSDKIEESRGIINV